MEDAENKPDEAAEDTVTEKPETEADGADLKKELNVLTDKWKRALADAENARKRADVARLDGREHGIALAVEALAPAFDAICLAIEVERNGPDADNPRIKALLEGQESIRRAFETGLKALGVSTIEPKDTPFDPELHEAMQLKETEKTKPGQVLVLHRPGFALGRRLIRPAHVTVSTAPKNEEQE